MRVRRVFSGNHSRLLWGLLCVGVGWIGFGAACGDPDVDRYPPDPLRFYRGDIPLCAVEVALDEEGQPGLSRADFPPVIQLPSVRIGSAAPYEVRIAGSQASEVQTGQLPQGMQLRQGTLRGTPTEEAAPDGVVVRYTFEVSVQDTEAHGAQASSVRAHLDVYPLEEPSPQPAQLPRYWEQGPYFPWSTQPDVSCAQNPVLMQSGLEQAVDLYMVHPTLGDPTVTGRGDVAPGRWPVIVFAHANNDTQCDINERYVTLHDHWASWGFVVVAVDGQDLNCARGSKENIELRTQGVLETLDRLEELDRNPESRFFGHLDLSRIVLAGHSRGGGASLVAAWEDPSIRAVIDLQGVDLTSFGFGEDPVAPVPVLGVTAGRDVDLNYPIVEPTEDQLSGPYSWVTIHGGIHAYTADTVPIEPDDNPGITQQQQRDITELFSTAFLARFVGVGDGSAPAIFAPEARADPILFSHRGAELVQQDISTTGVSVRWNRRVAGVLLDDFSGFRTDDPISINALGAPVEIEGLIAQEVRTYFPDQEEVRSAYRKSLSLRLTADSKEGLYRTYLRPDRTPQPLGEGAVLLARVKGPDTGLTASLAIQVVTSDGRYRIDAAPFLGPAPLSNRFVQLSIPLDHPGWSGRGPGRMPEVSSVAFFVQGGRLFVDDLRIE